MVFLQLVCAAWQRWPTYWRGRQQGDLATVDVRGDPQAPKNAKNLGLLGLDFTLSLIHAGHQSLCDVQLTPLPSPSIMAVAAGRGEGRGADTASHG